MNHSEEKWGASSNISVGDGEDIWYKATVEAGEDHTWETWVEVTMPGDQEEELWDETALSGPEEQETLNKTTFIAPPPTSATRVLEALTIYPIFIEVTARLERKDAYALALSCKSILYAFNIEDPVSHRNIISRCTRKCQGPYLWGIPEQVFAPNYKEHEKLVREGSDIDIQACVKKNCLNDACKHCRQPPPFWSELRRRWICGKCLPARQSDGADIPPCSCASAGDIFCLECAIFMHNDDRSYYDLSEYCQSDYTEPADRTVCKNGERRVYNYTCWDCKQMGEPPYDGKFICRWCNGSLPYTDLNPYDIIPHSRESCRFQRSQTQGGGGF
ncbi:hypothetical protein L873DRAFT_324886 [Choiromyces venosus 120613-1]|uniref:Uncharacterized protein n=1 Tax=Choiromyces venosus 120613-1 TaxID=1336337 RepID=A0A3N4JX22_9PEZI|nr:hypothetical protein L873DRAFT_324886 [Choiromyces venosus 120613-1]